ncbi:Rpe1 [Kluyveromyces lactis]|uniref:Ribulose-phosphate 3-epimerase n=1 Tax=Kluyveromyces lactis (strain ATCC 8585 / CBS 2359 / DSM 70799 / NBRC 1267 / NRRL Y-1140 / WM37) TaxID=284590 RepID=Q6CN60_KLULA|nr:uncharacterized protein KLLA0_E15071g [Kluyveromyces lactis]QEU61589.1 Rpe1 [Kluyveromyces lactis]CAG99716.1 KLLA0E15071p [Kluyveromyces lactis]|eukprot:XP_454629.1 uncharacterized protein KLLA0_E15071g [Kluyveromyces lactis]
MVRAIIAPSILASDFTKLGCECHNVINSGADWLHIDIMDGHFVPNMSLGQPVVESLRKVIGKYNDPDTKLPRAFFDCHMMVSEPERWVEDFARIGCDQFTFHYEATKDPVALVKLIKKHGMKAACSVKPGTPVDVLYELAPSLDMALVMTVEPGFGGQKFMADMMSKVKDLRTRFPNLNIQVDGGLGKQNVELAAEAGANVIVAGTSVFRAHDPADVIGFMKTKVNDALVTKGLYEK